MTYAYYDNNELNSLNLVGTYVLTKCTSCKIIKLYVRADVRANLIWADIDKGYDTRCVFFFVCYYVFVLTIIIKEDPILNLDFSQVY